MSSDFLCFLRLNFQTSTGDITHADLSKEGNTKQQRLAACGNILRKPRLAAFFFSVGFPTSARVATLVRKVSYQLINERPSSS